MAEIGSLSKAETPQPHSKKGKKSNNQKGYQKYNNNVIIVPQWEIFVKSFSKIRLFSLVLSLFCCQRHTFRLYKGNKLLHTQQKLCAAHPCADGDLLMRKRTFIHKGRELLFHPDR